MQQVKKPVLSIGMIVKNEMRCIEKCLKALQPLRDAIPCELVIADTGSTDGTRELVARYADIFFDFEWVNDFSAARNAVMDRCSGEWYLTLDADEYLDPDLKELEKFLRSGKKNTHKVAAVVQRNYVDAGDLSRYSDFFAVRMLRMSTGLRYEGSIHESWTLRPGDNLCVLGKTVLWHDGYLDAAKKEERNLPMLVKELEKNPRDLRRMMQVVESAHDAALKTKYARKLMELLKELTPGEEPERRGAACRDAVVTARMWRIPETKEWIDVALSGYADSLYTQVDVNYVALELAFDEGNYREVLARGAAYCQGIKRLEKEQAVNWEMLISSMQAADEPSQTAVGMAMACAHAELGEWDECLKQLRKYPMSKVCVSNVKHWFHAVRVCGEHLDLSELFRDAGRELNAEDGTDHLPSGYRDEFIRQAHRTVKIAEIKGSKEQKAVLLQNLASMGECDLAFEAQLLLAENGEDALAAAEQIKDWLECGPDSIQKLMEENVSFPGCFFEQGANRLTALANGLGGSLKKNLPAVLKARTAEDGDSDDPKVWLWNYALLFNALGTADWQLEDKDTLNWLLENYEDLNEAFLGWYYNPVLLSEENAAVLPEPHHFGWLYGQAAKAKVGGDTLGYVRWLRKALKAVPGMKGMVEYLLNGVNEELERAKAEELKQSAPPELLALAEQVRTLLAQYSPDDPAVIALKQSPVYQKVAIYIEGGAQE